MLSTGSLPSGQPYQCQQCQALSRAPAQTSTGIRRSIDIGARGKPDATGHRCGKIGDDITKEVVGDDDVESLGVSYQSDRDSVDVQVGRRASSQW